MTSLPALLLVGGGRMGGAMLSGWREHGLSAAVVVDPSPEAAKLAGQGVTVVPSVAEIPVGFVPEAVILAVKPQSAAEALPAYARFAGHAVFISIMAGKTLHAIGHMLGLNPRSCAPCPTPRPRYARALRWPSRGRMSRPLRRRLADRAPCRHRPDCLG